MLVLILLVLDWVTQLLQRQTVPRRIHLQTLVRSFHKPSRR